MRLTAEHVARVNRTVPDPGPQPIPNHRPTTDADYDAEVARMLATRPAGPFWLFAFGSLIWRPETAYEEARTGTAHGWHRRFCLGWDERFRGCPTAPGLMMGLDRGGVCKGVVYRLPEQGLASELHKLIRREMAYLPTSQPWRWISVATAEGPVTALTFAMNRKSPRYVTGVADDRLAEILATAYGFRGSMAEYLHQTVEKLEEHGIHDRNLWRLQELVAARIEAAYGRDR
jgi:cation transport protein ChaC